MNGSGPGLFSAGEIADVKKKQPHATPCLAANAIGTQAGFAGPLAIGY